MWQHAKCQQQHVSKCSDKVGLLGLIELQAPHAENILLAVSANVQIIFSLAHPYEMHCDIQTSALPAVIQNVAILTI